MSSDFLTAAITSARTLAPHVREITLHPEGPEIDYAPGQWISLRLPVGQKPPLIRAYSLATAPSPDGSLILCLDRVDGGLGSSYLWDAPVGTVLEFTGPLGNFVLPEGETPLVFVARFTGIVPFRAMLQALEAGGVCRRVHLVYGAENTGDLIYHDELTALATRAAWLDYHPIPYPEGEFAVLEAHSSDWMPFTPMVCGVREFTAPARAFFMEHCGLERRAVKLENYSGAR